jgi:mannose-6-phosphate isomerase-like protein (cupin superfamily)
MDSDMLNPHVEQIFDDYRMIAIIVYAKYDQEGIEFFTPHNFSQQLAFINRPKGYRIQAHVHKPVPRKVRYTQETLFIRSGKVKITFFSENRQYLCTRNLAKGDVILLVSGGHAFEMLEKTVMIEVKQGPYAGDEDKVRFDAEPREDCELEGTDGLPVETAR